MTTISASVGRLRDERQKAILRMRRKVARNTMENKKLLRKINRYVEDLARIDRIKRGLKLRLIPPQPPGDILLTKREREIMELLRDDLTNKEIGAQLFMSERTAKFHVSNLLLKYGCTRRGGLIALARTVAA